MGDCIISVIVPVKDEEQAIAPFVERVSDVLAGVLGVGPDKFEILFIDDGSGARTLDSIRRAHAANPRVRAISLSRNFGKEAALTAGLDHARGDAVVPMDVDLQDPPEVLPEMNEKWRDGFEIVYGVRTDRAADNLPKPMTA